MVKHFFSCKLFIMKFKVPTKNLIAYLMIKKNIQILCFIIFIDFKTFHSLKNTQLYF